MEELIYFVCHGFSISVELIVGHALKTSAIGVASTKQCLRPIPPLTWVTVLEILDLPSVVSRPKRFAGSVHAIPIESEEIVGASF